MLKQTGANRSLALSCQNSDQGPLLQSSNQTQGLHFQVTDPGLICSFLSAVPQKRSCARSHDHWTKPTFGTDEPLMVILSNNLSWEPSHLACSRLSLRQKHGKQWCRSPSKALRTFSKNTLPPRLYLPDRAPDEIRTFLPLLHLESA